MSGTSKKILCQGQMVEYCDQYQWIIVLQLMLLVHKIRQSAVLEMALSGVSFIYFYTVLGWYVLRVLCLPFMVLDWYCVHTVSTFYSPSLCLCLCPARSTQEEEVEEEGKEEEVYSAAGRWLR